MKRVSSLFIALCVFISIQISGAKPYQDIIVNNKVIIKGMRPSCELRYNAIRDFIKGTFKRPITILDIGAAEGYMTFKLAADFDATCVMIADPRGESSILPKLCRLNTDLDNVILLYKRITPQELELLSECEHFDVVLALNMIHHFPTAKWEKAAQAIMKLGDHIIIETPPLEDRGACGQERIPGIVRFIESKEHKIIAKTKRHTSTAFANTYLLKGAKKEYKRGGWFSDERCLIHSLANNADVPIGISLITFKMLNGTYPEGNVLKKKISDFIYKENVLFQPKDIVLQGNKISVISTYDRKKYNCGFSNEDLVQQIFKLIDTEDKKEIFSIDKMLQGWLNQVYIN